MSVVIGPVKAIRDEEELNKLLKTVDVLYQKQMQRKPDVSLRKESRPHRYPVLVQMFFINDKVVVSYTYRRDLQIMLDLEPEPLPADVLAEERIL